MSNLGEYLRLLAKIECFVCAFVMEVTMNYNFYDFAKAYQDELRSQANQYRLSEQIVPSQPAARDRLLTSLGNILISLGEMIKSWRTCPDLGCGAEVSRARV